jgi:hypothetical protein
VLRLLMFRASYCTLHLMQCAKLCSAHLYSCTLDCAFAEPKSEIKVEQVQRSGGPQAPSAMILTLLWSKVSPGAFNQCPCLLFGSFTLCFILNVD